jgi:hypothetical protein
VSLGLFEDDMIESFRIESWNSDLSIEGEVECWCGNSWKWEKR